MYLVGCSLFCCPMVVARGRPSLPGASVMTVLLRSPYGRSKGPTQSSLYTCMYAGAPCLRATNSPFPVLCVFELCLLRLLTDLQEKEENKTYIYCVFYILCMHEHKYKHKAQT